MMPLFLGDEQGRQGLTEVVTDDERPVGRPGAVQISARRDAPHRVPHDVVGGEGGMWRRAASRAVPIVVAVDGTTEMRIRAKKKWFLQPGSEERKKLPPVHLEQRLLNKHDLSASTAPTPSLLKCVLRYAK
jgi:hypothetical protein